MPLFDPKSQKDYAQLGGKATAKKYGKEHYKNMANKRWNTYRKQHGDNPKKPTK